MPLRSGYSYKCVQDNIVRLMDEGYERKQAIAIAFENARKWFFKRHPHGALPEWLTPVSGPKAGKRLKNPVPLSRHAKVKNASDLYERFTGHNADEVVSVDKPELPDVMLVIGEIDGIMYSTVRDGELEKYIHKFSKSCRPTFAVSHDGKQLFMLGGAYNFTERGIIDKTKGN